VHGKIWSRAKISLIWVWDTWVFSSSGKLAITGWRISKPKMRKSIISSLPKRWEEEICWNPRNLSFLLPSRTKISHFLLLPSFLPPLFQNHPGGCRSTTALRQPRPAAQPRPGRRGYPLAVSWWGDPEREGVGEVWYLWDLYRVGIISDGVCY